MGLLSNKFNDDLFVMLGPLFTWKFVLLVVILVCSVFLYRFFCRFLCPLGAIYGLFNKISFVGVKLDAPKCTDCGRCVTKCKMDVKNVGDTECISCGECISVCPTKAINWKGPKILLRSNEIDGNLSRESKENALKKSRNTKTAQVVCVILSVSLLIGSLYYFNFVDKAPDADPPPEQTQQDPNNDPDVQEAVVGNNIGNQCIAMDIKLLRGQEGYFNVNQNKGKVTIINFWGNWCGPCVQELPHFNEIAKEYAENVTVVAVHSDYGKKTADNYISENFSSFVTTFALDDSDAYFKALGGRDSWPVTVIVDPDGIIIFKQVGSVTYEELQNAVSPYVNN